MPPQRLKGIRSNNVDNSIGETEGCGSGNSNSRVIRAIQESTSPKLASINSLLQTVVQSARSVVKGTDSQRKFNAQFSEFCRSALVGISDLEEAVYELEKKDGCVENYDNSEYRIKGITTTDFIKEIVSFVASQTTTLGAQYLEHVGMSAVQSAAASANSNNNNNKSQLKSTDSKRVNTKRGRSDNVKQRIPEKRSPTQKQMETSPSLGINGWDSELLSTSQLPPTSSSSLVGLSSSSQNKLGRNRGVAGGSHHGSNKLTNNPLISTWLQPWTLQLPNAHGIALDRVTTERPKTTNNNNNNNNNNTEDNMKLPEEVSVFDICAAPTASEVLRLWETRESLLSSGVDRSLNLVPNNVGNTLSLSGEEGKEEKGKDNEEYKPMFFPSNEVITNASVSTQVLTDLVYYGISALEVPFKDMV